jgi:hypothetical protein
MFVIRVLMADGAMMRIEAARRIFPRCWFNEKTTEAGRDALGYYHERLRRAAQSASLRHEVSGCIVPQ